MESAARGGNVAMRERQELLEEEGGVKKVVDEGVGGGWFGLSGRKKDEPEARKSFERC